MIYKALTEAVAVLDISGLRRRALLAVQACSFRSMPSSMLMYFHWMRLEEEALCRLVAPSCGPKR